MCGVGREAQAAIGGEMPGVTKYNLVDDAHDLRIPMHNEEVFKYGVCFEAKVRQQMVRMQNDAQTDQILALVKHLFRAFM